MCGIAGIQRFDGAPVDPALLEAMIERLVHRGPDGGGVWTDGPVGFGHRRLAIIDPAGSPQPMASADGRAHITFNGEIVNYAELRAATPYPYRTRGDTEVILALHAREGAAAVARLRGQFAYALHDGTDLWLHRDRLGILPLYYAVTSELLAFASEIKALLPALDGPPQVDHASLDAYLAHRSVPAPFTLVAGVRKLLPGHRLRVRPDGDLDIEPYWRMPDGPVEALGDGDAVDRVEEALRTAVQRSLVADVEVGSLLSGGVDSSLVVALATAERDGRPIDTFAAGFGDPRVDELHHARVVAERFGTRHHEVVVGAADFEDRWRRLTWHRDAPLSEPADVAVHALALEASGSVKVLLSGEGSDELFGGYPKHTMARWGRALGRVPTGVRTPVLGLAERNLPRSMVRERVALRALAEPDDASRLTAWFAPFTSSERARLLDHDAGDRARSGSAAWWLREPDPLRQMLAHDRSTWLADNLLERGDRMAMAASVELRPPLLDHELVELASTLPSDVLVRGRTTKWVLKEVARRHLPASIVDRPKAGFRVPLDAWFRSHLRELARDTLLASDSFVGSVMDRGSIAALLTAHERGRRDESIRIWTLVALEQWHEVLRHGR